MAGEAFTRRVFVAGLAGLAAAPVAASEAAAAWAAVAAGRAIVLMRHAHAPGTGDPPGFQLGNCATQRNLSSDGRAQAQRAGDVLRENGIANAAVYSSRWCRASETARLLGFGEVAELPVLDSFFGRPEAGPQRRADFLKWLGTQKRERALVCVTHQVNITAFTGVVPASGEMVLAQLGRDGLMVLARVGV